MFRDKNDFKNERLYLNARLADFNARLVGIVPYYAKGDKSLTRFLIRIYYNLCHHYTWTDGQRRLLARALSLETSHLRFFARHVSLYGNHVNSDDLFLRKFRILLHLRSLALRYVMLILHSLTIYGLLINLFYHDLWNNRFLLNNFGNVLRRPPLLNGYLNVKKIRFRRLIGVLRPDLHYFGKLIGTFRYLKWFYDVTTSLGNSTYSSKYRTRGRLLQNVDGSPSTRNG